MTKLFLGIDIGGTVIKAGIYDQVGNELSVAEQSAIPISPKYGFSERDMEEMWATTCIVIRTAIQNCHEAASNIQGISFSAHGKGLFLLDSAGKPVRNGIVSSDSRAIDLVSNLKREHIDTEAYQLSYQQVWSSHPAVLLKWLKLNEPRAYEATNTILMAHDYIRYRMTGKLAVEETNFSGSLLFNLHMSDHDQSLYSIFGINELFDKQVPVIGSTDFAGEVTESVASLTGLKTGTPVYGGLFDVVGSAIASGVTSSNVLSAVTGTWSISTRVFDEILPSEYPYVWGKYCIKNKYFVHEGSPTSASNLAWFVSNVLDRKYQNYGEIERAVERALANMSSNKIYFYPWLYGSNHRDGLNSSLIGLSSNHTQNDILLAIFQGIVFSHLIHQDRIVELHKAPELLRFSGGATNSQSWVQLFSDASGIPVEIVDTKQIGCRAAAMTAAVGCGFYSDFEQAGIANMSTTQLFLPSQEKNKLLRNKYQHFLTLADAINDACGKN